MNINGTIVVQAINFFISYLFLRYLFLKPAVAQLDKEEAEKDALRKTHEDRVAALNQKQQKSAEEWRAFQEYFQAHRPSVLPAGFLVRDITPPLEQPKISDAQINELAQQMHDLMVNRFSEGV